MFIRWHALSRAGKTERRPVAPDVNVKNQLIVMWRQVFPRIKAAWRYIYTEKRVHTAVIALHYPAPGIPAPSSRFC